MNSEVDHWGAYSYDEKSDVLRVKVPVKKSDEVVENFTIQFNKKSEKEATMKLAWDTTLVEVSISF